jgi:phospho-N-acetylmuramoyl-pentapeptide-transferase
VIWILVAAAVGLAVTLLGTPVAIRAFRIWGWGQRIREDGPHTHYEKVGTPTMGGIVMLVGLVAAYGATRFRFGDGIFFTPAGASLILAAVGFGVVGFIDDYLKVRRQRSLGLSKMSKFIGTAVVSVLFAVVVVAFSDQTGTSTSLSFVRPTALGSTASPPAPRSSSWPRSSSSPSGSSDTRARCWETRSRATTSIRERCRTPRSSAPR